MLPWGLFVCYNSSMTEAQITTYEYISKSILELSSKSPSLIAISGKDASGKTIMANILAEYLKKKTSRQIIRISADDFMNQRSIRRTPTGSEGESCYKYTFNFDLLKKFVLEPLQVNGSYIYKTKVFDQSTDCEMISDNQKANDDAIVIIDGVFLFRKDLVNYWSLKVLLETDDDVLIERGALRDAVRIGSYIEARDKYINRYIASQTIYYNEEYPEKVADIIVNNNDYNSPVVTPVK